MHSRCSSVSPFMFLLFSAAAAEDTVVAFGAEEDEGCFFFAASEPLEDPPVPLKDPLEDPSEADLTRVAASLEDAFFLASPFGVEMRLRGIFGTLIGLLKTWSSLLSGSDAA